MKSEELKDRLQSLLDSDIAAYEIERQTGVGRALLGRYRDGTNSLDNMTIATAGKLEAYGQTQGLYHDKGWV